MDNHIKFTEWAVTYGVTINGVAAHRFPGRGLGIIAEKNLEVRMKNPYLVLLLLFSFYRF